MKLQSYQTLYTDQERAAIKQYIRDLNLPVGGRLIDAVLTYTGYNSHEELVYIAGQQFASLDQDQLIEHIINKSHHDLLDGKPFKFVKFIRSHRLENTTTPSWLLIVQISSILPIILLAMYLLENFGIEYAFVGTVLTWTLGNAILYFYQRHQRMLPKSR